MQRTTTLKLSVLSLLLLLAFAFSGSAAASDQWIHVKIDGGRDGEEVRVNLPLSLVSAAAALIPEEAHHEAEIALDDLQMSWGDLRKFWDEVKAAPEATFVTVQSRDETVKVRKEGDFLLVKTSERSERGTDVDIKFPLAVVDALLSGPDNTLNFEAALHALAAYGPGNLVSVHDGDSHVQVWIDDVNEAD